MPRVFAVEVGLGFGDGGGEGVLGQCVVAAEQLRLFHLLSGHLHMQRQHTGVRQVSNSPLAQRSVISRTLPL